MVPSYACYPFVVEGKGHNHQTKSKFHNDRGKNSLEISERIRLDNISKR